MKFHGGKTFVGSGYNVRLRHGGPSGVIGVEADIGRGCGPPWWPLKKRVRLGRDIQTKMLLSQPSLPAELWFNYCVARLPEGARFADVVEAVSMFKYA